MPSRSSPDFLRDQSTGASSRENPSEGAAEFLVGYEVRDLKRRGPKGTTEISCPFALLPRDVFISVEQRTPGNLDPDEWAILRRVIDLIKQNANGAELGPVLETIENALRADQAKPIE